MIEYRGYYIHYDPPPIPTSKFDWHYQHKDADEGPDTLDNRYGSAPSLKEAKRRVDEMEDLDEVL